MTWYGIVNPSAGRGKETLTRAERALRARAVDAELVVTASADEVGRLVAAAAATGTQRFIAVGGDGTVNLVVDAMMRQTWTETPTLGILPAGSGCDFVRTFAISQRMEDAASHLTGDGVYGVDVGHVTGPWGDRYFLNAAGAGLGAAVVAAAARYPSWLGAARYKVAVWPTLVRFPRAEVVLDMGSRRYEGPAVMIVMANGQFVGGGMNVAPRASLIDGELDIQVFAGPKRQAVVLQPRMTRGTHLSHRAVRRFSAGEFRLESDPVWPVEVDGEYLGSGPVTGRVLPMALNVKI